MSFAIYPTNKDDYLDAEARADPRTYGIGRQKWSGVSDPNRPDFELVEVTPEMRRERGLASYVDYVLVFVDDA